MLYQYITYGNVGEFAIEFGHPKNVVCLRTMRIFVVSFTTDDEDWTRQLYLSMWAPINELRVWGNNHGKNWRLDTWYTRAVCNIYMQKYVIFKLIA